MFALLFMSIIIVILINRHIFVLQNINPHTLINILTAKTSIYTYIKHVF